MSISSKSRKESTESFAAQAMHNTMGIPPALAQLNDRSLDNDLPSRVASSSDTDVPGDVAEADSLVAEADDANGVSDAAIEEAKRASWGQAPLASDDTTNSTETDWTPVASQENVPATRANEPERTLGNA